MKKRMLTLILALVMLLSACALASCGQKDPPQKPGDTTVPTGNTAGENGTNTPEEVAPPSKILDRDIRLYGPRINGYDGFFSSEGHNGDVVNDAIFDRNAKIEELFDVTIVTDMTANLLDGSCSYALVNSEQAGDHLCDFFIYFASAGIGLASRQLYYELLSIPTINTAQSYWDQAFLEEFTKNGHCYQLTGDIETSDEMHQILLAMNERIYDSLYPEKSIFEIVNNYEWTIEEFMKTYADYGSETSNHVGFVYDYYTVSYFLLSSDIQTLRYDDQEKKCNMDEIIGDRAIRVVEKIKSIFDPNNPDTVYRGDSNEQELLNQFCAGNVFVEIISTFDYFSSMTDMKDTIWFLPFPMFDSDQKAYYTPAHNSFFPYAIPHTTTEQEAEDLGMILECMAYYSAPVTEAVYEITISLRMSDTPEVRDLLVKTYESRRYDFDYISGNSGLRDNLATLMRKNSLNLYYSAMKSNKDSMCGKMESVLSTY